MRSKDKMDVTVKPMGDKDWAIVQFKKRDGEWVPSFEDLYRVIQAICYCEDKKYPPPLEGRGYVRRFLIDCCEPSRKGHEKRWQELVEKYRLKSGE